MKTAAINSFIGYPSCFLKDQKVTLLHPKNRLFMHALEGLAKITDKFNELFMYVEMGASDTQLIRKVQVFDVFEEVATITTYEPSGESRTKDQLQIAYNYEVHTKSPKSVRRSSDARAIQKMIDLIRPVDMTKITHVFSTHFDDAQSNVTRTDYPYYKVDSFFRSFYYGDTVLAFNSWKELINGGDGGFIDWNSGVSGLISEIDKTVNPKELTLRGAFEILANRVREYSETREAFAKEMVGIVELPRGKYWEVRRKKDGTVDWSTRKFNSRDELPDDVAGRLAVMDIKLMNLDDRPKYEHVVVEGVGAATCTSSAPLENIYVFSVSA
jgi:hypothetical protein